MDDWGADWGGGDRADSCVQGNGFGCHMAVRAVCDSWGTAADGICGSSAHC